MTEVRTRRAGRLLRLTVDSVLIVGMLVALIHPPTASAASIVPPDVIDRHTSNETPAAVLRVDPSTFWMHVGENVTLRAVWSIESPFCVASPIWYWWTVGNDTADGFLNETNTSSTVFTAESFVSRTGTVGVQSAIVLTCGSSRSVVDGAGLANISVVVPLSISVLTLAPAILSPGENATLDGSVAGGEPPYVALIDWGDGTSVSVSLSAPGSFSFYHSFPTGVFLPFAHVSDSVGDMVNGSVEESVPVGSSGFHVVLLSSVNTTEVGDTVDFSGLVLDSPRGSVVLYDCTNATVGPSTQPPSNPNATGFSCTFHSAGTQEVVFGAYSPSPGGLSANAVLYEPVVAPPSISATPITFVGEVGGTLAFRVELAGGEPPVSLSWNLTGNRSSRGALVEADGAGVVLISLTIAGLDSVDVRASDSHGEFADFVSSPIRVDPRLSASATGGTSIVLSGANVTVVGDVSSGCAPFTWWAVPSIAPSTGSSGTGVILQVGGFSWDGTYAREANLSLNVGVADGCGDEWHTAFTVSLLPALSISATTSAHATTLNETLELNLTIEGGWPPFSLFVNVSDDESWNRSIAGDGTSQWQFDTTSNGTVTVTTTVVDSLGSHRAVRLEATFETPSASPPPTPPSSPPFLTGPENDSSTASTFDVLGVFASGSVLAAIALGVALLWRRRARRSNTTPGDTGPDPVETLRRIIEPAEGAERFTVELLAEEAGVPLPVVRSTIDRLVSERKVHSESGADGEEVLSWSAESGH